MALLCSIATGNASDASTWGVVDATSYLGAETVYALTTSYTVPTGGGLTTPGAITVSHLLIKLANRTGTTGTFRTALYSATGTSGTADAAVTSTTGGTLTDTRASWSTDEFVGAIVTCNGKTGTVTSNTATVLTVSGWSGGSNPGNGNAWSINVVQGTSVAINCSDLPVAATADINGGWIAFKLPAPVTLLAATQYGVMALTSTATQVSVFCTAFTNLSRALVTTTTAAPTTGDDMIIVGEKTGAGTGNNFTVTWDITASTDFGSTPTAANSLITPGIAVCNGGTLQSGTTAATAYVMKLSNSLIVYSGGTLNFGTSGTPIPSGSSFTLTFDCGTNVDYGLVVRNLSTVTTEGTKGFTSSPSNHYTLLTADEAAGQTVIGSVGDTTGWEANDEVFFGSTSITGGSTHSQHCKIASIDSSTAFTLTTSGTLTTGATPASLSVLKAGVVDAEGNDVRGEIGNLTRNVVIKGASATLQGYINIGATAVVNFTKTEFYWLGSATSTKQGIYAATTTGTFVMTLCSLHNFEVTSSVGIYLAGASGGGTITITKNVGYQLYGAMTVIGTTGTWTITYNVFCRITGVGIGLGDVGGVFSNNILNGAGAGGSAVGIRLTEVNGIIGTMDSNTVRANNGDPAFYIPSTSISGIISNLKTFRNNVSNTNSGGFVLFGGTNPPQTELVVSDLVAFGNYIANVTIAGGLIRFTSPNIQAGSGGFVASNGLRLGGILNTATVGYLSEVIVENGLIGTVTAHSAADVNMSATYGGGRAVFHNTQFGNTEAKEVLNTSLMGEGSFICSLKHDGTTGLHKTWKPGGRATGGASLQTDTTVYNTASPSLRMYPGSASIKLKSSTWEVAVASGNTLTPSVYVRESVVGDGTDYNGNRIRLCVRRNVAAGISADTVIATATGSSEGAWELISGTTVSVTDDAILEFFVDCDGTTGWVNVDDFSCVGANPGGMKYWSPNHAGPLALGLPAGGGGAIGGGNLRGGFQ